MNTIFGMRLSIGRGLVLVGMFAAGVVSGQPCYVTGVDGPSCIEDGSVTLNAPATSPVVCIGDSVTVTATVTTEDDWNETVTHYDHCDDVIADGFDTPTYGVTWTATVGSYTTSGTGLTATFTPTDCGAGTVTFSVTYTNASPCNDIGSSGTSGNFTVESVNSLTASAGQWVDDGDNDPNTDTYLVEYGCNSTITVTAADNLGLSASALPGCWTVNMNQPTGNATFIDYKTFSVDGNTVGTTTINVTCGSSTKTITIIVFKATFQADSDSSESDALWGHAWWILSVTPSLNDFLTHNEVLNQGAAGWYDSGDSHHHGMIESGTQYIGAQPLAM